MWLLNIFYLKCILTGMDVSGLSPGYPLTLEPPLVLPGTFMMNNHLKKLPPEIDMMNK